MSCVQVLIWKHLWKLLVCRHIVDRTLHVVYIRVIIQWRHLRREPIHRPSELIESLIVFKLATTLPSVALTVISLECGHSIVILGIVHCTAVHASQTARMRTRELVNILYWQHLKLRELRLSLSIVDKIWLPSSPNLYVLDRLIKWLIFGRDQVSRTQVARVNLPRISHVKFCESLIKHQLIIRYLVTTILVRRRNVVQSEWRRPLFQILHFWSKENIDW